MSHVRAVLLAGVAFTIIAAACSVKRARPSGSPRASLEALADGIRARDRIAIERYLDVQRTAQSVVDEAFSAAATVPDQQSSLQDDITPASLVPVVELSIWTTLLDPAAIARYQGVADVQQQDDGARAGVRIRLDDADTAVLVHLRMERNAGDWRVVGVAGLGPYLRAGFERRRDRAYELEMRSDLRNMMTAEGRYFAEHGTYVAELSALPGFSPTPGVSVEIVQANGGGWRAVARHEHATSVCRVAIGTAVPPGDVAGAVQCTGGG